MTTSSTLAVALAVLCVVSLGVSATTLESSVRTDPDDVIDLDWDRLPIGEQAAVELKAEMNENEETASAETSENEEKAESREPVPVRKQRAGDSDEAANVRQPEPDDDREGSGGADGRDEREESAVEQGPGGTDPDRVPWYLLWLLVPLALAAVVHRYADRWGLGAGPPGDDADPPPWPPGEAMTAVDRAWLAMVRNLDVDRPWTRTPAEFADAAVEAGMDPEAVEAVTAAFEEVRYGGAPAATTHRKRARWGLRRLDVDPEGDSP